MGSQQGPKEKVYEQDHGFGISGSIDSLSSSRRHESNQSKEFVYSELTVEKFQPEPQVVKVRTSEVCKTEGTRSPGDRREIEFSFSVSFLKNRSA